MSIDSVYTFVKPLSAQMEKQVKLIGAVKG